MKITKDNPFVPIQTPQYIQLDLTPATISHIPDNNKARIIVTDAHYYIFLEGPDLVESGEVQSFTMPSTGHYVLNETIHIERSKRCDCGTSLKGFHPFVGVRYASIQISK